MTPKDDPEKGTVKIKEDDLTETFSFEELSNFRISDRGKSGKTKKREEPAETVISPEAEDAISGLLDEITRTEAVDLAGKLEAPPEIKTGKGSYIGDILLVITDLKKHQVEEALTAQRESHEKERLGEILMRKKLIKEDDLMKALSFQLNIPIIADLSKLEPDPELIKKVPINFARQYNLLPLRRVGQHVQVAIHDAVDFAPLDDIRILLGSEVRPVLAKKSTIIDAINRAYDRAKQSNEDMLEGLDDEHRIDVVDLEEAQDLIDATDEAPIIKLVNNLLFRAAKERASDVHFDPLEREMQVRYRIDGVLYNQLSAPKAAQASITSRIKIMAKMDIAEKRIPQDGRIRIKIGGKDIDIRVSTLPTIHGEKIVMRLLDKTSVLLDLADIGFSQGHHDQVMKIIGKSHGIFLVTGPTGSGKTTTLYAALTKINSQEKNIITVEDPVEYQLQGIGQIHVNPKVNLTFASGLRSILRQDPDVIMVGEIRDGETAEIAIQASLTGHLVFSTLHTNDAATAFTRLIDMGVEPFLVASSIIGVMAQRLIRVVCKDCRQPYKPSEIELNEIGINISQLPDGLAYKSTGCPKCWQTGYQGRTGIYELMMVNDTVRDLVLKNADSNTLKKVTHAAGMKSLREHGARKVLSGITTIEEVMRVTQEENIN